jgi:hypothetical protein
MDQLHDFVETGPRFHWSCTLEDGTLHGVDTYSG